MNYLNHSLKASIVETVMQLQMVLKSSTSFE